MACAATPRLACPVTAFACCLRPPAQVVQGLSASREVVIFDNPRAGLSNDSSTAPLSIEGMAASTMELLRALELERPDVLGFSLGGMVALAMAAGYSGELGAVVSGEA